MPWRENGAADQRAPIGRQLRYAAQLYTQSHHTGGYSQQVPIGATIAPAAPRVPPSVPRTYYLTPVTRLLFEGMTATVKVSGVGRAEPGPLWSALAAADAGWHVFPCAPGSKRPALRENWQDLATTDPGRIRAWWARQPYNIGIACGPSGLVVIDLDVARDRTQRTRRAGARRPRLRRGRPRAAVPGPRPALPGRHLHRRHAVRWKPPVLHRARHAGAELGRAARAADRRPGRRRLRGRRRQPDRRARATPPGATSCRWRCRCRPGSRGCSTRSQRCPRSPGRCRRSTRRRAGPTPWPPFARRPAGSPRRGSGPGTTRSTGPRSASASWSRPG